MSRCVPRPLGARLRPFAILAIISMASLMPRPAAGQSPVPDQLSMRDAVSQALLRHPAMTEARADVDAFTADRLSATRRPNPAVSIASEGYPLFEAARPGYWANQEFTIRLDQEIEMAGRRGLRTQMADASRGVASLTLRNRARQIELDVRRAYLSVVLAQADRGVAQTALDAIDRVITLNRERFNRGELSGMELRRLQVERLRFVEDVFAADLAVKNTRATLLALLNAPALNQGLTLTDDLTTTSAEVLPLLVLATPAGSSAPEALTQALALRPDVLAARQGQSLAETSTRLQRALRTPNVTVGGGYRSDLGIKTVVLGLTIPLPLFNQNQGGVARAEAERRAADARTVAAEAAVRLDVQRAVNALETNRARVDYIEREYLTSAEQSRDIVLESYRLGVADLIDFLDAQRAFRDTVRTYNRALFDQRVSLFELAAAVGLTDAQP